MWLYLFVKESGMKRAAWSLVVLICYSQVLPGYGQGIAARPSAIASYYLHIDPTLGQALGLDEKDITNINMRNTHYENSVLVMDSTFNLLYYRINSETNIELLPLETLVSCVRCTRLGYPFVSLKKAAKKGKQLQYVTIEVSFEPGTSETLNGDNQGINTRNNQDIVVETKHMVVSPNVRIDLEFGDYSGKKVATFSGIYSGNQRVQLGKTSKFTSDIYITKNESNGRNEAYYVYLNLALDNLVKQVNAIVN